MKRGIVLFDDYLNDLQDDLDKLIDDKCNHEIWMEAVDCGLNGENQRPMIEGLLKEVEAEISFLSSGIRQSYLHTQHPALCWMAQETV